jgi:hypothetical protein
MHNLSTIHLFDIPVTEEHEIRRIVRQSADQCLAEWQNGEGTWEPRANLNEDAPELLKRFRAKQTVVEGSPAAHSAVSKNWGVVNDMPVKTMSRCDCGRNCVLRLRA